MPPLRAAAHNPKYGNNYRQTRALLAMTGTPYRDLHGAVLAEGREFPRELSRIHYTYYDTPAEAEAWLAAHDDGVAVRGEPVRGPSAPRRLRPRPASGTRRLPRRPRHDAIPAGGVARTERPTRPDMRILVISTCFHPKNSIASYRIEAFARYFREAGHSVTVLTEGESATRSPRGTAARSATSPRPSFRSRNSPVSGRPGAQGAWLRRKLHSLMVRTTADMKFTWRHRALPRSRAALFAQGGFDVVLRLLHAAGAPHGRPRTAPERLRIPVGGRHARRDVAAYARRATSSAASCPTSGGFSARRTS